MYGIFDQDDRCIAVIGNKTLANAVAELHSMYRALWIELSDMDAVAREMVKYATELEDLLDESEELLDQGQL